MASCGKMPDFWKQFSIPILGIFMSAFDLVLINTPFLFGPSATRLGLLTIASYIREQGYSVTILRDDLQAIQKQLRCIKLAERSIIGITATTDVAPIAFELCAYVKKLYPTALCVIGGNHSTALPERTLRESLFDLVVVGEGELTLAEVIRAWKEGKTFVDIPGIAFLEKGRFIMNSPRELIKELDILPFPAYDLVDIRECFGYIRAGQVNTKRCLFLLVTRGCPFDCVFCGSKATWHRQLRWYSIDYIINLIQKVEKDFDIDSISFLDDELVANRKNIIALTEQFKKTGLARRLRWECHATVNSFDLEVAKILKSAGCISVRFGFESGCQKSLDFLKSGRMKVEDAHRAVKACKEAGLYCFGSFIIGSPNETLDDIMETIQFIEKSRLRESAIFVATPYPGTYLYNLALEKGYLKPNLSWADFVVEGTHYKGPLVRNEHFSAEQLGFIKEYIDNQVCKLLNNNLKPRILDHRRELEKILNGNLAMTHPPLKYKIYTGIYECFTLFKKLITRPHRIPFYVAGKIKTLLRAWKLKKSQSIV